MPAPLSASSRPKCVDSYSQYLLSSLAPEEIQSLLDEFRSDWIPSDAEAGTPLPGAELPWQDWLLRHFPHVCSHPFGKRHTRLWEWFEALRPGEKPRARVEVWPRGGAKSTSTELGCARCCIKLSRRYVLYVSETQEQADKHVQSIASLLETLGVERALNQYGTSKGWRRQELRTANGFNVSAYGLDTAARGVKLDQYRPDLVVLDDIDSQDDSARTIQKKIDAITTAIIPAGSSDCAVLLLQNLIHEEGVFAQLVDGRADFLHDREPAYVEPAIYGLTTERTPLPDGRNVYRITGGTPTWAGQSLAVCERQINEWGLRAFLREAQHEVRGAGGYVFDTTQLRTMPPSDVPPLTAVCLAWDLAATEGGGDWTVGVLLGRDASQTYYVLGVIRGQWSSERVRKAIHAATTYYRTHFPNLRLRLPQDPGQAGKDQAAQFRAAFPGARVQPVTGDKATRASGFAEAVNLGNVALVEQDLPESLRAERLCDHLAWNAWHLAFKEVLRKFREDETDQVDDDVDAAADAFNELTAKREIRVL